MLPVQYASTINIGVLDGQFLILLLVLKHSGMTNTNINYTTRTTFYFLTPYTCPYDAVETVDLKSVLHAFNYGWVPTHCSCYCIPVLITLKMTT